MGKEFMNPEAGDGLIRLSKSVVGEEEKIALNRVIDIGYLGMGKGVQQFERELQDFLGVEEVVCVNSGTAALQLALMGAGIGPGDEVLVQSITYVASCQAIRGSWATPVFCEVSPETITIDLNDAESKLTPNTKAIMPVHYAGGVGKLQEVYEFAKSNRLRVIEDAAHAFGTWYRRKKVGSFGDIICFSFDGIKNITSGEGGAVVTSDSRVAEFVRDARLLGVHKDSEQRYQGLRSWEFEVTHQGYRYHMSDLFAAIGSVQLKKFPQFQARRQKLAKNYDSAFSIMKEIELLNLNYDEVTPHIYPLKIKNGRRDELRRYLENHQIQTGIHYFPNHWLDYFRKENLSLPVTEKLYEELITIPLHPGITDEDQRKITTAIQTFFSSKS